jgi:hypothetical protein
MKTIAQVLIHGTDEGQEQCVKMTTAEVAYRNISLGK